MRRLTRLTFVVVIAFLATFFAQSAANASWQSYRTWGSPGSLTGLGSPYYLQCVDYGSTLPHFDVPPLIVSPSPGASYYGQTVYEHVTVQAYDGNGWRDIASSFNPYWQESTTIYSPNGAATDGLSFSVDPRLRGYAFRASVQLYWLSGSRYLGGRYYYFNADNYLGQVYNLNPGGACVMP